MLTERNPKPLEPPGAYSGKRQGGVLCFLGSEMNYLTATTGAAAKVRFRSLEPFTAGKLTAWKHNYIPVEIDNVTTQGE